jgi:hypothetical protein
VPRIGCRKFQGHPSVYHEKPVPRTVPAWIPNGFTVDEATGRQLGAFHPSQRWCTKPRAQVLLTALLSRQAINFGFTRLLTIGGATAMGRPVVSEIDLKMMERCVGLSKTVRRHGEFPFTSLVCNGERVVSALGKPLQAPTLVKVAKIAQGLSWSGIVRLGMAVLDGDVPNAPRETLRISNAFASKSLGPVLSEMDAIPATFDAVRAFRRLGARPIRVLTQMILTPEPTSNCAAMSKDETRDRVWLELQNDIASWSVRSTHRIVCDAGHNIQFDRPDGVVAAILEVVSEVRSDPPSRAQDASLH